MQQKYDSTERCWWTDQVYKLNKPGGTRNNQVENSSDVGSFITADGKYQTEI